MATTNVGNLHVKLMMTDRQFQTASNRVRNTNRQTEQSMNRLAGGGMKRMGAGFLELSRGVEDFAVSFSTGGFAAGLRGAGNNISQFASMVHPLAGALAGLGVAGATAFIGMNKAVDKTKKKVDELEEKIKRGVALFDKMRSDQEHGVQLEEARGGLDEIGAIEKRLKRELNLMRSLLKEREKLREEISDRLGFFQFASKEEKQKNDARLKELREREKENQKKIDDSSERTLDLRRKRELKKAEQEKKKSDELNEGRRLESEGIQEGKKKSFEERQKRIRERNRKKEQYRKDQERERERLEKRRESLMERRADLQEQMKERRRVTELPSGDDFFSASAQNRLSRIAAGRFQGDKVEQKMLKELEKMERELRDIKNKLNPVKPVTL